jgi:hypothetical protein
LKILLSNVGLSINYDKTKVHHNVDRKVSFNFLGFEFIIMPRSLIRESRLFSNKGNLHDIQNARKGFAIILKPKNEKIMEVKTKLKKAISKIHRVSRNRLFKSFQLINSILTG